MAPVGCRGRGQGRAGKREVKAWATRVLPRGEGTPAAPSSPECAEPSLPLCGTGHSPFWLRAKATCLFLAHLEVWRGGVEVVWDEAASFRQLGGGWNG